MIIFKPILGLCNRLRSLDAAIALATKQRRQLYVIWELNIHCNCKFSELFLVPKEITAIVEVKPGFTSKALRKIERQARSHFSESYFDAGHLDTLKREKGSTNIDKALDQVWTYLSSHDRFFEWSSMKAFSWIQPRQAISDRVDQYRVKDRIGVHIRRTDNAKSIQYSPTQKFIEYMNQEVNHDKNACFFLATDDPTLERHLRTVFPNRIAVHPKKSLDRQQPQAVWDAAIDLYCLAHCRKLIGSYWSSFSEVASQINGIDTVIVRN
ncbi:MAG: hypothetical protein F6J97_26655 [Leptolyngbya sp. SIO4C1]|nr:hypothetical protein [Leptolyngbya sp. SIO4C1]